MWLNVIDEILKSDVIKYKSVQDVPDMQKTISKSKVPVFSAGGKKFLFGFFSKNLSFYPFLVLKFFSCVRG